MKVKTKKEYRKRRHLRARKKVTGTAERPRMAVFVSNKHLYVQFIDDTSDRTLAAVNTRMSAFSGAGCNGETAKKLGEAAGAAALEKGIKQVVFDRAGFAYEGRMKILADAVREAGVEF